MEKDIARQCKRRKLPLPDGIENAPVLLPELEFFYTAYSALSTCRQVGAGVGPIPWTAIVQYAEYHEFTRQECDSLILYVAEMDKVYIEHCSNAKN